MTEEDVAYAVYEMDDDGRQRIARWIARLNETPSEIYARYEKKHGLTRPTHHPKAGDDVDQNGQYCHRENGAMWTWDAGAWNLVVVPVTLELIKQC